MRKREQEYWTPTEGLFFPEYGEKVHYKIIRGQQYRRDSWGKDKSLIQARIDSLESSGCRTRLQKRDKKGYVIYRRCI